MTILYTIVQLVYVIIYSVTISLISLLIMWVVGSGLEGFN